MNVDAQTDIVMPGENAETIIDDGETTEVTVVEETTEVTSESSPDTGENQEQKHNGVQQRINDLTAKRYAAERETEQLKVKLAEAESQKPTVQVETVTAPELPDDQFDQEAMQKYHKDMIAYSKQEAHAVAKQAFEDSQKTVQDTAVQKQAQDRLATYAQNAVKDGVDMDKLKAGEQMLNNSGISAALGAHIMSDKNGGKIVEFLYDNPADMHEVLSLDPVSAGIHIANVIKAKALSTTPKVSKAPDPITEITGGGGVVEKDDFDRKYPGTTFN